ncbi:DEAD/DEAH box helicase [Paracidovorax konjaci]|uniref:Superfamily II DNA or RNA helicase, SNF2 family n=1 Tax=Paracidovorax konjaci TaxID=32040 RepID=A0A1I1WAL7_9BURK|nr:DEAD/DEAH box helicase [Paracidovorax konjaci]SFD92245.1 Superfamily II DNA or RNA helicase, SNF2 family [Paracidovorax konjaci]
MPRPRSAPVPSPPPAPREEAIGAWVTALRAQGGPASLAHLPPLTAPEAERAMARLREGPAPAIAGAPAAPTPQAAPAGPASAPEGTPPTATARHPAPAPFQPRLTLRTLGRGDGLLGMRAHGGIGPRGGNVTLAQVDWTYRLDDGNVWEAPAPVSVLNTRPPVRTAAPGMAGGWLHRDVRAEANAIDTLRDTGLVPVPADRLQWRAPGQSLGLVGSALAGQGLPLDEPLSLPQPPAGPLWTLPQEAAFGDFWADTVPRLQALGWAVVVRPGFAHESVPVQRWRIVLDRATGDVVGKEAGPLAPRARAVQKLRLPEREGAWLLSLGVEIDGETLDLAPMVADLLRRDPRWLDARELAAIDDHATIRLRAPGGRRIDAPAAPLKAIVGAMVDLLTDPALHQRQPGDPLHLGAWEARRIEALRAALDQSGRVARQQAHTGRDHAWQLQGDAGLAHLAGRLQALGTPQPVAPPAGLAITLRPYQREGLAWLQYLRAQGLGGILADDMGLGKTAQALAHILAEKEAGRLRQPALVVVPTSLLFNWQAEAARMAPGLRVLALHGPDRAQDFLQAPGHDLVLTTYPLLWRDAEALAAQPWHLLILDEAQMAKNAGSRGARALRQLRASHLLCLTGTPLENHLGELWAHFDFLMPGFLDDARSFAQRWRKPIEENGETLRAQLLAQRVRPFILRRRKDDVAPELPPRTTIPQRVTLQGRQRELYEAVRTGADKQVRRVLERQGFDGGLITILDALLKLRQVCCDPRLVKGVPPTPGMESAKLDRLAELLPALLDEGRRVLVFSQFTGMLALVAERLQALGLPFLSLTGRTAPAQRGAVVQRFQDPAAEGSAPILLASLKAGGTGLNLTAADTVIHLDPWWNPAVMEQATARAHRIGQDKPVFIHHLVVEGSIEERMLELQARKQALTEGVLGSDAAGAVKFGEDDLRALLAPLSEPRNNPLAIAAEDDPRWGGTGRRRPARATGQT